MNLYNYYWSIWWKISVMLFLSQNLSCCGSFNSAWQTLRWDFCDCGLCWRSSVCLFCFQELNFNFHTIILPEALKTIQTEEPTVLAMVNELDIIIAGVGCPLEDLLAQLEMHLRYTIMEMDVSFMLNLLRKRMRWVVNLIGFFSPHFLFETVIYVYVADTSVTTEPVDIFSCRFVCVPYATSHHLCMVRYV